MLRLAFTIVTFLDAVLACAEQKQHALTQAHEAVRAHGHRAVDAVLHDLRHERARRSRRTLRLAVAHLVADRYIVVRLAPVDGTVLIAAPDC